MKAENNETELYWKYWKNKEKIEVDYKERKKMVDESFEDFVLPISAETYIKSVDKNPKDYSFKSVDSFSGGGSLGEIKGLRGSVDLEERIIFCKENLIQKSKNIGAEVITDYKLINTVGRYGASNSLYLNGVALIPKEKSK